MAFDFQVTIDCAGPHELADWWAEALGWQVEAQDEAFIHLSPFATLATASPDGWPEVSPRGGDPLRARPRRWPAGAA